MEERIESEAETTGINQEIETAMLQKSEDIWHLAMEDFQKQFGISKVNVKAYSPLSLAYIGDTIFDMIFRTLVVSRFNMAAHKYHKEELFTEGELEIYKRGRNSKPYNKAKNASVIEYQRATGLEALIGYLYLDGRMERIFELVKEGICRMNGGE